MDQQLAIGPVAIGPLLLATFPAEVSSKLIPSVSRESSVECPRILVIPKVADKNITSSKHKSHLKFYFSRE